MLVLTRKSGERVLIGDDIVITVLDTRGDGVRIGIDAPAGVRIYRDEVIRAVTEENVAATHAGTDAEERLKSVLGIALSPRTAGGQPDSGVEGNPGDPGSENGQGGPGAQSTPSTPTTQSSPTTSSAQSAPIAPTPGLRPAPAPIATPAPRPVPGPRPAPRGDDEGRSGPSVPAKPGPR